MGLYENSDVYRWGINLLEDIPGYYPGCYGDAIQYDTGDAYNGHSFHSHSYDAYDGHCFHNHYDTEFNQVENDESIARALQEEIHQLEIGEPSGYSQAEQEQFSASEPSYDCWHNTSTMNYCSAGHHGGVDNAESSYSCYIPYEVREYPSKQTKNDRFDDEIRGRLSQMVPTLHVPKINGEIPSTYEATSDHQRLKDRLQLYDFVEHQVQGDGNCQFHALSDQLFNSPDYHESVRAHVVNQLKSYREIYEGYVPMEYDEYVKKMSRNGEWGDHVTLQAAADSYCVRIFVMTSFKDTCLIEILPHFENPKGVIFLSFWAEVHYNSIYPQGDTEIPSYESRRKKRWWNFGTRQ